MASEQAKYEADYSFVKDRISEFFDRGTVRRALDLIEDVGITGFEKWWQVEFAAWLSEHDGVGDWVMEERFLTDQRLKARQDTIAIDIGFRMKGFSTKELLFIEMKQHADWRRCVENMLSDYDKVDCAQTYSVNGVAIRSIFMVPRGRARRRRFTTTSSGARRRWTFRSRDLTSSPSS